ncbi:MAG: glycosyltransferase [Terriglobales bacterium]
MNPSLHALLEAGFWTACALVVYTYVLYPVLLFLVSSAVELNARRRRLLAPAVAPAAPSSLPAVSVVVAAHNEQQELPGLIACLRCLDYPRDRIELVVVSDGSSDGTEALLENLQEPWVRLHRLARQQGKAAALNVGVAGARFPLLLLTDASTRPQADSLRLLMRHFADAQVGVVCGALRFRYGAQARHTEGAYWAYECLLRLMEASLGATLTASGAFYAVRKACFPRLPETAWIEDFLVPMHARQVGYRVLYDPEAWAGETPAPSVAGEFRRRVRLAVGSFRAIRVLVAARLDAATRWALISHKLLRWLVPFLLLGALACSAALWSMPLYRTLFCLQAAVYALAAAGAGGWRPLRDSRLACGLGFFCAMNAAFLWGFVQFLRDRKETSWQQVR